MTFQTLPFAARVVLPFIPLMPLGMLLAAGSAKADPATDQTVLVTATRQPQPAADILLDHDTISREDIANAGAVSVAQLLQKRRGIEITANGGAGSSASVFLRGASNSQSIVLVDGVKVGSATTGGATWATIPLSQIDHIEIVYGPLSSLYGADGIGGVIQIFTKQGGTYLEPSAGVGVGSYGTKTLDASIAGSSGGESGVRFSLGVARDKADGFSATKENAGVYTFNPDRDGYERNSASGQLSWKLAPGHELGASFLQSRLRSQFDAGPGFDDRSVEKLENLELHLKSQLQAGWKSQWQLSRSVDKNATDASYGSSQYQTTRRQLGWQNDFSIAADTLQVVLERQEEQVDSTDQAVNHERNTNSLALSWQARRDQHLLTISARRDNNSQYGGQTTGSIAYGYRIDKAWRVSASLGTSFRAPVFNELYFPGFGVDTNRPERGRNFELGLHHAAGLNQFQLSYYHNRITDLLVYVPVCPVQQDTHQFGCEYNVNQATLSGFSFGGSTGWQQWRANLNLDVQDPRDDTTGKRLARRARQHGSVALNYDGGRWHAGVEEVFASERFDDAANRTRLGGYGLVNVVSSWEFARNWSVLARWNNIANKQYELAKGYATPGSNGFLGLRYGSR